MKLFNIKSTVRDKMAESLNRIITLQNEKEQMKKQHEKELDDMCVQFLAVIDTFEKSEALIKERGWDQEENAARAIQRLLNAKRKAISTLEKIGVVKIELNGMMREDLCATVGTEPDASRKNDEIISIEKDGFTRNGHLIRRAEVVIVKN